MCGRDSKRESNVKRKCGSAAAATAAVVLSITKHRQSQLTAMHVKHNYVYIQRLNSTLAPSQLLSCVPLSRMQNNKQSNSRWEIRTKDVTRKRKRQRQFAILWPKRRKKCVKSVHCLIDDAFLSFSLSHCYSHTLRSICRVIHAPIDMRLWLMMPFSHSIALLLPHTKQHSLIDNV